MPSRSTTIADILTPRLRLRAARPDDLAPMHAVMSNADAMRYWSTPPHGEIGQTRAWLEAMIAASPQESCDYIVEYDGAVIGKAGCWRLPEIGFILHPEYWGRGFAKEALTAVIAHAFAAFPIPAIEADVDPRNAACLGLLQRLGFAETHRVARTVKVGEEWCDSVYLSLPRSPSSADTPGPQPGRTVDIERTQS